MNLREAERIAALSYEVDIALELLDDEDAFRDDPWRPLAAERLFERIFQASEALTPQQRDAYFGPEPLRYLRGLRNRLAHNYLDIDLDVLWTTIRDDLPRVRDRLLEDATRASAVLEEERERIRDEDPDWERDHLRRLPDSSDDDS
ncbi:HepT-like ribonuclease domain-containing protein [Leifsonia shinshuensis]